GPPRQQVQVLRLGARDDVVRTRDGIDGDDAIDPSNHLGHVPGLAHFRLDQDVGANHRFPFSPGGLPIVGGATGLPQIGRSEPRYRPTSGSLRAGVASAYHATSAAPSASTQALTESVRAPRGWYTNPPRPAPRIGPIAHDTIWPTAL